MLEPTGPGSNASMFKRVGGAISLKDTTNSFAVPTGRCATVVVAASDSPNKEAADFICEAGNIDAIKTAVAALPATGDRKILLMGDFTKDDVDAIEIGSNIEIELMGSITFADAMGSNAVIFANVDTVAGNENINIHGGILDGNKDEQTNEQTAIKFTKVGQSAINCVIRNIKGKNIDNVDPEYGNKFVNRMYANIEKLKVDPDLAFHNHPNWRLMTNFETDEFAYLAGAGTAVYDTTEKMYGTRSIKFSVSDGASVYANTALPQFLFAPIKNRLRMWVKIDNPTGLTWAHNLSFRSSAGNLVRFDVPVSGLEANVWTEVITEYHATELLPDHAVIDMAYWFFQASAGEVVNIWIDQLEILEPLAPHGIVSLGFSDGEEEHYSVAYKNMQLYGYAGIEHLPHVRLSHLHPSGKAKEMQDAGWDIINHSHGWTEQSGLTEAEVEDDICRMSSWLKANGYVSYEYYAPPGGLMPYDVLTKSYSLMSTGNQGSGINVNAFPNTDCFSYPYLCDNYHSVAEAKARLDIAIDKGMWIIFDWHAFNTGSNWTTANFIELLEYINEKHVPVRTYSDILGILYEEQKKIPCKDSFWDVLATDANHVVAAEDLTAATPIICTIAAQPDVPRNITIAITDGDTSISAFQIDAIGLDAAGHYITEQFLFNRGLSQTGIVAFSSITSIAVTSIVGDGAGDTLDVGIGNRLGLTNFLYAPLDVFKVKKNTADYPSTNYIPIPSFGVVDVGAITAGDDFTISYKTNSNAIVS